MPGKVPHGFSLRHSVRAVLNETLRLFTPLPSSIRDTRDEGVTLPQSDATYHSPPMYMPPKTPIIFFFYLMQRNKALWGSDAEEFKPERWFDQELQQKVSANPAIFTPFASGPRNVSDPISSTLHPFLARMNANQITVSRSELRSERGYAILGSPSSTL